MANDNEIPLEITVDTKSADKSLADFQKTATKSAESIESAFSALKVVAAGVAAVFAGKALIHGLEAVIDAAAESDQAVRKLAVSLASTGEFSDQAVKSFEDFASAIQKTTQYTDEAVLGAVSLAKNFGITNDAALKLTKAAIDLAAATGTDLDTAVQQLGGTFSGTAGRLSKTIPQLKNLTEEELKAGAAIDIVAGKFKGFAEANSQTFTGALKQTQNAFGEIFESIGKIITQNPIVIAIIRELGKVFNGIADVISDNKDAITEFLSKGLKALVGFVPTIIRGLALLIDGFSGLLKILGYTAVGFIELSKAINIIFSPILEGLQLLVNTFIASLANLVSGTLSIANSIPGVSQAFQTLGIDLDGLTNSAEEFSKAAIEGIGDTSNAQKISLAIDDVLTSFEDATVGATEFADKGLSVVADKTREFAKVAEKEVGVIDALGDSSVKVTEGVKNLGKAFDDSAARAKLLEQVKGSFDKLKSGIEELQKEIDKQTLGTFELIDAEKERSEKTLRNSAIELALTGKLNDANSKQLEIFNELIQKKAELATNQAIIDISVTVGKGLLDAASTIGGILNGSLIKAGFDVVQQFLEFPKTLQGVFNDFNTVVDGLIRELPGIIDDLIQRLPEIGKGIAAGIGKLVELLAEKLPDIVSALVDALTPIIEVIFEKAIPTLIKALPGLIKGLLDALPGILNTILGALPEIIRQITAAIPQIVKAFADALPEFVRVLIDNAPDIAEALAEGFAEGAPNIINALVDSLIFHGGLERIIKSLVIGAPRVGVAIVVGMVKGTASAFVNIGNTIASGFKLGVANVGSKIGGDFGASVAPAFQNFLANLASVFQGGGAGIASSITGSFQAAFAGLYSTITGAFQAVFTGLYQTITSGFTNIFGGLYQTISSAFQNIFGGITDAISQGANRIKDALFEPIDKLIDFLHNFKFPDIGGALGNAGSSAGGFVSQVTGSIPHFASGGLVPAGFPNDGLTARLGSGELVIPQGDTQRLSQFLDQQQAGGSGGGDLGVVQNLLASILQKLDTPMTTSATVQLDNRTFANIMLDLSRNNARLAA